MVRREAQRLDDILEAIRDIDRFTAGMDADAYVQHALAKGAVVSKLVIIGEAVKHLPAALRARHPAIAWSAWAGLGDMLVHQYFRIDHRRVWRIVRRDIPPLRAVVDDELKRLLSGD